MVQGQAKKELLIFRSDWWKEEHHDSMMSNYVEYPFGTLTADSRLSSRNLALIRLIWIWWLEALNANKAHCMVAYAHVHAHVHSNTEKPRIFKSFMWKEMHWTVLKLNDVHVLVSNMNVNITEGKTFGSYSCLLSFCYSKSEVKNSWMWSFCK